MFGVRTRRGIVAALLIALFIVHWQVEGLRWQMIPVYGAALGLAIGDILAVERRLDWTPHRSRHLWSCRRGAGSDSASGLARPRFARAHRARAHWHRHRRTGGFGARGDLRAFTGAGATSDGAGLVSRPRPGRGEPVLWSEDWDIVAPGVSTLMGFPGWFLSHTKYSSSHGGSSIPVAPGTFPVVIYSHGWTGFGPTPCTRSRAW